MLKWEIAWLEQREQGRLDRQMAEAGIASQVGEAGLTAVDEAGSTTKWMTSETGLTEPVEQCRHTRASSSIVQKHSFRSACSYLILMMKGCPFVKVSSCDPVFESQHPAPCFCKTVVRCEPRCQLCGTCVDRCRLDRRSSKDKLSRILSRILCILSTP